MKVQKKTLNKIEKQKRIECDLCLCVYKMMNLILYQN